MQKRGGSINSKILSLMGAPLWPYTVRNARKMTSFFWFDFLLKFTLAKSLCFLQWMTEIKFLQKHWNNFGENWIFSCNYSVLAEIVRFLVFRQTCFGAETPKIAERAEIPKPNHYSVVHWFSAMVETLRSSACSDGVACCKSVFIIKGARRCDDTEGELRRL